MVFRFVPYKSAKFGGERVWRTVNQMEELALATRLGKWYPYQILKI